jgi:hypothetical protein
MSRDFENKMFRVLRTMIATYILLDSLYRLYEEMK